MRSIYRALAITDKGPVTMEYETLDDGLTVVAFNATLEDFKGQPVTDNAGVPSVKYKARTVKDCSHIDKRIYMHLGQKTDGEMVNLINVFLQALKQKDLWIEVKVNPFLSV